MSHSAWWAESYRTHQTQMRFLKTLPLLVNSSGCLYLTSCHVVTLRSTRTRSWSSRSWHCPSAASTARRAAAGPDRWSSCRWEEALASLSLSIIHSPAPVPNTWGRSAECVAGFSSALRATSPPAPSTWSLAPTAALSSWRAATCPITCSTTALSARSSVSFAAASSPARPTR